MFADDPAMPANWMQIGIGAGTALLAIVFAVSQLFKTMGTSYGSIIAALQSQNASQQSQINQHGVDVAVLKKDLEAADEKCDERIKKLEAGWEANRELITETKCAVEVLTKRINGTPT